MSRREAAMRGAAGVLLLAGAWVADPLAAEPIELRGRVVDADRRPLSGAQVTLRPLVSEVDRAAAELAGGPEVKPLAESATGADGGFTIRAPEPGMWRLTVIAKGSVPVERDLAPLLEAEDLPDARLMRDAGLEVRVTDPTGRPLPGAWVEAAASETTGFGAMEDWRPAARRVRADADGVARLPRGAAEEVEVRAFAPGLAEATAAARRAQVRLQLAAGPRRTMRVQSAAGAPVAGALVLAGRGRWPLGRTRPDGKLGFVLANPEAPVAIAAADAAAVALPMPRGGERESEPAVLSLPPTFAADGRVVDARTRRPIAGAVVWVEDDPSRSARTGGDGAYRLPGLSGEVSGRATAAGYLVHRLGLPAREGEWSATFALAPAARLAGTVVDEAGSPIAGAEVAVAADPQRSRQRFAMGGSASQRARSAGGGRFELRGLDPRSAYDVRVSRSGYALLTRELEPLEQGPPAALRLVLQRGAGARVRIVDARRSPIAGAEAALSAIDDEHQFARLFGQEGQDPQRATADASGFASFGHLPGGRYDLAVEAAGFGPLTVPGVRIPESGTVDLGTVTLEPGVAIEGRVVDGDGAPLAETAIWIADEEEARFVGALDPEGEPDALTAGDGHFRIADRRPGERLNLLALRTGFTPGEARGVTAPTERPLRIVLHPGSRISGQVVDADEKPVAHAAVGWIQRRAGQDAMWVRRSAESVAADRDGRFLLRDVVPGSITLSVRAPGFQPTEVADLEVPPGKDVDGVEVVLLRGAVVAGRVVDAEGEPEIGALVEVAPQRGAAAMYRATASPTDGDGRYRLDGVEPGRRVIGARADDGRNAVGELDVALGENTLDLRIEGGVEVSGTVVDARGSPVAGAGVAFFMPGSLRGWRQTRSGADGTFQLAGMLDGEYVVSAARQGQPSVRLEQPVKVQGAPISGLEIRLPAAGAITGELRGLEFRELAEVRVWGTNRSGGGGGAAARPDHSGRYRLENVTPGDWVVQAAIESSGRQAEGRVQLEPGQEEAVLDLEFGKGLTLAGRVLRGEEPVGGAWVGLEGLEAAERGDATTDHEGAFRIQGLEAGRYVLRVTLGGFPGAPGVLHRQELHLEEDREITIELATGEIVGRVVDAEGRAPLAGATLSLEPAQALGTSVFRDRRRATSDSRGAFRLADLAGGAFRLRVEREGYASAEREIVVEEGGREEVEIELQATEGLTLKVAFAAGGRPATVRVALVDGSGRSVGGGAFDLGPEGEVRVTTAPRGTWEALVVGDASAVARLPVLVPGPPVPLVLEPGATLQVSVPALAQTDRLARLTAVDALGRAFQLPLGDGTVRVETNLTYGRGVLRYLPAGVWRLVATDVSGQSYQATVQVAPGAMVEVALE